MSIEIPGEVSWLFPIVVGASWPEGDEDALRRVAQAWTECGVDVGEVLAETEGAVQAALNTMQGQTHDAFQEFMRDFTSGEGHLPELRKLCEALGEGADKAALEVEYTKLSIIAALIILAAQIAAMIASAVATFGASTAGIPIAQAATQITVRSIFMNLLRQIVINVGINLGVDVLIQGVQKAAGNRDDWDWSKTGSAVVAGAAAGVAGGAVDGVAGGLGQKLGKDLMGNATSNFTEAAAYGAARGSISGVLGNSLNSAAHGELPSWEDVKSGATSGGVAGATSGMQARHDGLSQTWNGDGRADIEGGGQWVSGENTQGWAYRTEDGSVAKADVESPYRNAFNSENVGHRANVEGGPNNVNGDEYGSAPNQDQQAPKKLDLPEGER